MRTTVSIHDELLASARLRARERGVTLSQLIEDGLRRELSAAPDHAQRPEVPVFRGRGGLVPGVDISSSRALYELLDDGVPLDKRR